MIVVDRLRKVYRAGRLNRRITFQLDADFIIERPGIVGLLGPNGAGKTTLFDLIAGGTAPTTGRVFCAGENIHKIRHDQRCLLVNQRKQRHHTRMTRSLVPNFLLRRTASRQARVHLFDEPDMDDWYFPLFVDYVQKLRDAGALVVLCVHPTKSAHLQILERICQRFLFVADGTATPIDDFAALMGDHRMIDYIGDLGAASAA